MKLKLVVVDLELSKRAKRIAAAVLAPLIVLGGGAIAYASVPHTWSDGDTLAATDLNGNFTALDQRIVALEAQAHPASAFRAWLSTTGPTFNNGAPVSVAFDHVDFDLGSEYTPSTGVFSPKQAGVYLLNCGASFGASAGSTRYQVEIFVNGTPGPATELSGDDVQASAAGVGISSETTIIVQLAAGDSVTCGGGLSGASQTVLGGLPKRNRFSAARLY